MYGHGTRHNPQTGPIQMSSIFLPLDYKVAFGLISHSAYRQNVILKYSRST